MEKKRQRMNDKEFANFLMLQIEVFSDHLSKEMDRSMAYMNEIIALRNEVIGLRKLLGREAEEHGD